MNPDDRERPPAGGSAEAEEPEDTAHPEPTTRAWLESMLRDRTLWPVFIAGALVFATLGAALLVLALSDRNLFALAALAIVIVVNVQEAVRAWRRGSRRIVAGLAGMWLLSGLGAFAAMLWIP